MPPDEIELEVPLFRRGGGPAKTRFVDAPVPGPMKRSLRAAQMLSLAYRMDRLIESGAVRDRAEMARVTGFDDSRISQIMNLMWLAPDIQESVLLAEIGDGRDWVTAKELLPISRCPSWEEQRRQFECLLSSGSPRTRSAAGTPTTGSRSTWSTTRASETVVADAGRG
ncbi:MAG: hypothetical protein JST00_31650 [Deltaproteobacteria bacterium]|nr:hypothetical protein [Deltaproteobacteria bacterium]